ncbi:MAG: homoserine dehydrogenase [Bacillota bacterium]
MTTINLGLLGLGTVGSALVDLIEGNAALITSKIGKQICVRKVLVRSADKPRKLPADRLTLNFDEILSDPSISVVVELMGGIEPARAYVSSALRSGKHVVTANKDLISEYGQELFQLAAEHGAVLLFEGSVGGGIPVIRPLKQCLAGDHVISIFGILNGTTNYILTKMTQDGMDYGEALSQAQALGYAEADPASDVRGLDAARKLAILSSIAFNVRVKPGNVYTEGIERISARDILYAKELGCVIKLTGIARETADGVDVRVHPSLVPADHPLATVHNAMNALFIKGAAVGELMFYGPGAGGAATATAVLGDILEIADGTTSPMRLLSCTCFRHMDIRPVRLNVSRYYIRILAKDKPGTLAKIAGILGKYGISLRAVIQKATINDMAEVVFVTHPATEQDLNQAMEEVSSHSRLFSSATIIRFLDGT